MENQKKGEVIADIVNENEKVTISEKRKKHSRNQLFWPLILILVGVILVFRNLNLVSMRLNWWAAFIFIPVVASLSTALRAFQKSGKFDLSVRSALGSAMVVGTVATLLLLDMDWSRWWPLMVIAPGISMLIGGFSGPDSQKHRVMADWMGLNLWMGVAVVLLGVGFLIKFLPIPSLEYLLNGYRWWSVPILLAGLGAFVSAFLVCLRNGYRTNWTVWAFTGIGVAIFATGLFALLNLNLNLLSPIILIAAGLVVLGGIFLQK
ncbi:MAG: hypothetical protein NTZ74_02260 [Chloroflexi bacterium]|nr:hypothetical protein [Chloroflexota bacterium]